MKITVYSSKGGVGKTPISVNLAMQHGCLLATNDPNSIIQMHKHINQDRLYEQSPSKKFPKLKDDADCVFDLGGFLTKESMPSIRSAIEQSDIVIIPTKPDKNDRSISSTVLTIREIQNYGTEILVLATDIEHGRGERAALPTNQTAQFINMKAQLEAAGYADIPILPFRRTKGLELAYERGESLELLASAPGLPRYTYRHVLPELNAINTHILKVCS